MKRMRKLAALVTVFLMVFGSIPFTTAIANPNNYNFEGHQNASQVCTGRTWILFGYVYSYTDTRECVLENDDSGARYTALYQYKASGLVASTYTRSVLSASADNNRIRAILAAPGAAGLSPAQVAAAKQAAIWNVDGGFSMPYWADQGGNGNSLALVNYYNTLVALPGVAPYGDPVAPVITVDWGRTFTYKDGYTKADIEFKYQNTGSALSGVTFQCSAAGVTFTAPVVDGGWVYFTAQNVPVASDCTITVRGNYDAQYDVFRYTKNSYRTLVGYPYPVTKQASGSLPVQFGGIKLRKLFASGGADGQSFTVNLSGGPGGIVSRSVSVPDSGTWVPVMGLPYGNYAASEALTAAQADIYKSVSVINASTGDRSFTVHNSSDNNGNLTVTNEKLGSITVRKSLDSTAGDTRPFDFTITGPGFDAASGSFSLANGESKVFNGLSFGTYTVTEAGAAGYRLIDWSVAGGTATPSGNAITIAMDSGNRNLTVTANNQKYAAIHIAKTDNLGQPVKDVQFSVKKSDGAWVDTGLTGADGTVDVTGLVPGDYEVKEIAVPAGYTLNGEIKPLTLTAGETETVGFVNNGYGSIVVTKVDKDDESLKLGGAVFQVSNDGFVTYTELADTDMDGVITFPDLLIGNWSVREVTPPSKYLLNETVYSVTVAANTPTPLTVGNVRNFGDLTVTKELDSFAGDGKVFHFTITGPEYPAGLAFDLSGGEHRDFTGLLFGLYTIAETPETGYLLTGFSGGSGVQAGYSYSVELGAGNQGFNVTVSNRKLGSITVRKVLADGITVDPGVFHFTISGPGLDNVPFDLGVGGDRLFDNLDYGEYTVTETGMPDNYRLDGFSGGGLRDGSKYTVTVAAGTRNITVTCTNQKLGQIQVYKQDSKHPSVYLPGAQVKISTAGGADFDAHVVATLTTAGDAGTAVSDWLAPGTYYLRETAPPAGYRIDSTDDVAVTLHAGELLVVPAFTDTKDEGSILVRKTSSMTEGPVAGVRFELLDLDPKDPGFTDANILAWALTDDDGEVLFEHLVPGQTYWVRETVPASGYDLVPDNEQAVTVVFNTEIPVGFANSPLGYLRVNNVNAADDGVKLTGTVYGIYLNDTDTLVATVTTGAGGTVLSGELKFGAGVFFTVKELTPHPDYLPYSSSQTATFSTPGEVIELTFRSVRNIGSIVLLKVDALDGTKKLAGAEFALYSDEACTKQVGKAVTTGADGVARFDGLIPGNYWFKETKAPKDYDLLPDAVPVTAVGGVTAPEPIVVMDQYNPPNPYVTGTADWTILLAGGIVLALGLLLVVFARKRAKAAAR